VPAEDLQFAICDCRSDVYISFFQLQIANRKSKIAPSMTTVVSPSARITTFLDGPIDDVIVRPLKRFADQRGWLIELFRDDELDEQHLPAMAYVSETLPGVARGPHEHVDQTDYFAFVGPGDFRLYLWDTREGSATCGNRQVLLAGQSNPTAVIVPPGVVHAYRNVSDRPGWVFNAPNRLYACEGKKQPVDEIRHEDVPGSPFVM
jgi:dTDP-4-dehydrorhamnose 3,5-epimerase